jgi:hypothetical protein
MTYKIEKVSLAPDPKDNRQVRFAEFVDALRDLQVGESFKFELKLQTTHRLAVTIASRLLKREYVVRKEKHGVRIGRLT